jgi:ribosomal protein S18 acetylase RimI-like enzyme
VALTVLTSAAEVLLAADHHPYVRSQLRSHDVSGWAGHGAVAWRALDTEERLPYLMTLGQPAGVAELIADLVPDLRDGQRITLPRGTARLLPAWVALDGTDWDFWWTSVAAPERSAEAQVVEVSDDEVAAMLTLASPRASALPGDDNVRRWMGIRGPSGLLACGADTSSATGVGHLSSIAVHPDARGQGYGAAVTGRLIRDLLAVGNDLVVLGMYADNTAGRALYRSLGMTDDALFTSGSLQIRSRW